MYCHCVFWADKELSILRMLSVVLRLGNNTHERLDVKVEDGPT